MAQRAQQIVDQLLESSAKDMLLDMHSPEHAIGELEQRGYRLDWKHDPEWMAIKEVPYLDGQPAVRIVVTPRLPGGKYPDRLVHAYGIGFWGRQLRSTEMEWLASVIDRIEISTLASRLAEIEAAIGKHPWRPRYLSMTDQSVVRANEYNLRQALKEVVDL